MSLLAKCCLKERYVTRAQCDLVQQVQCKTSLQNIDKFLDVYFAGTYQRTTGHVLKNGGRVYRTYDRSSDCFSDFCSDACPDVLFRIFLLFFCRKLQKIIGNKNQGGTVDPNRVADA